MDKSTFESRRREGFGILVRQLLAAEKTFEELVELYTEAGGTFEDVAPLNLTLRRAIEEATYQLTMATPRGASENDFQ
jgi:hypothetical protein